MARMNRVGRWLVNRRTESRARRALRRLGPALAIPHPSAVLELGSGGGGLLALLQERFEPSKLIGTDFDPDQVMAAKEYLTARWGGLRPSVELRQADAAALPFPDGSFDFVFAMMMLHHVDARPTQFVRRPLALREVRRVLRPQGRLVYSEILGRKRIRETLASLGFEVEYMRSGWRSDIAIYRKSTAIPPG
jgi:ubiquinone/menaquinone biosynthesis C-methylase UbiE